MSTWGTVCGVDTARFLTCFKTDLDSGEREIRLENKVPSLFTPTLSLIPISLLRRYRVLRRSEPFSGLPGLLKETGDWTDLSVVLHSRTPKQLNGRWTFGTVYRRSGLFYGSGLCWDRDESQKSFGGGLDSSLSVLVHERCRRGP